jgi:hypothetical protein
MKDSDIRKIAETVYRFFDNEKSMMILSVADEKNLQLSGEISLDCMKLAKAISASLEGDAA